MKVKRGLAAPAQYEPSKNTEITANFSQVTILLITQGRKEGVGERMGPALLATVNSWIGLFPL